VRNIDCDERDLASMYFAAMAGAIIFIGLELDDQIQLLPDQVSALRKSDFRLITIVRTISSTCSRSAAASTRSAPPGRMSILPLRGIADPKRLAPARFRSQPVTVLANLVQKSAWCSV